MDDLELVHKLKNGDESAYRLIIEKYQSYVLNCCFKFVNHTETAEDLTQEVFIEVYKSVGRFRSDSKFSTWLYRIAVTKSLDHLKSMKRKKRYGFMKNFFSAGKSDDYLVSSEQESDNPQQLLEKAERIKALSWAVGALPENQKVAFTLSKYDELSYKEIAEILDTTVSSVESLLVRAKSNLKKKLYRYYETR